MSTPLFITDTTTLISKELFIRPLDVFDDFLYDYSNPLLWFPIYSVLDSHWENKTIEEFLSGTSFKYEFAINIPLEHQQSV